MLRLPLVLASLLLAALPGCGENRPGRARQEVSATPAPPPRTDPAAASLRRACREAAALAKIADRCPRRVLFDTGKPTTLLPRANGKPPLRLVLFEAHTPGDLETSHWVFGWGSPAAARKLLPGMSEVRSLGSRCAEVRFAPYPEGGMNGSHVGVLCRGAVWRFVTAHDPAQRQATRAVLESMPG